MEARVFEQRCKKHNRRRLLGSGENDFWQADPDREVIQDRGRSRGAVPDPGKMRWCGCRRVGIDRLKDGENFFAPVSRGRVLLGLFCGQETKRLARHDLPGG